MFTLGAKTHAVARQLELHYITESHSAKKENTTQSLKRSLSAICKNPVWIFITVIQIVEGGMLMGLAAFTPKVGT